MTAPLHSRDIRGKGRWYGACSEDCPFGNDLLISVTNAQGVINKPALPPAAAKETAKAAWDRLPQMVSTSRQPLNGPNGCDKARVADRCGECRFCVNAAIKAEYKQQWEAKADLGTLIHAHAAAAVIGQPMVMDPVVEPFIRQYVRFLKAYRVNLTEHIEAVETTILHRKAGYAGTGDLWIWLPTGAGGKYELALVDLKTSLTKPATAVYPDQILQLAGLRFAPEAILPDDSVVKVPKFARTFLLNLRQNDFALIEVPADRAAHSAFVHAVGLQRFMQDVDTKTWPVTSPPGAAAVNRRVA